MKELLDDSSNQLQSSDMSGSIAWSTNNVFAKVMGKERKGRIRGVGFSPTPSGRSSKSALTNIEIHSSQARTTSWRIFLQVLKDIFKHFETLIIVLA